MVSVAGDARPRVALVHDWLTGMRGGERVLEALAERFPEAPIHTLFHFPGSVSAVLERHEIRTSFLQRAPLLRRQYRRYLPLFPLAIEDLDLTGFDLVISTSHCVAKGVIPRPGAFHLCYCHSPMRYAWDQERAYFSHRRGLFARLRSQMLSNLRTWDVASCPRVDLFVANSHYVAERIARYWGRAAEVVAPPVAIERFTPTAKTPASESPYCLSVAALSPYKRHDLAIAACARLGLRLRIVGEGPDRRRLERLGRSDVELLGRVEEERLIELYRGAMAFVQPGIEDFGIATVEALACGTPVVAASAGGVLDIVENGKHGFLYDPANGDDGLATAIDNCRQFRFNPLDLRHRAEWFSRSRFEERLGRLLAEHLPAEWRAGLAGSAR